MSPSRRPSLNDLLLMSPQVARAKHKRLSTSTRGGGGSGFGVETRSNVINDSSVGMGETSSTATSPVNVRAVCPFSSATLPSTTLTKATSVVDVEQLVVLPVVEGTKSGGCPAHVAAGAIVSSTTSATSTLVVDVDQSVVLPVVEGTKKGGCPAHAASSSVNSTSIPTTKEEGKDKEEGPPSMQQQHGVEIQKKKGGCPAHASPPL